VDTKKDEEKVEVAHDAQPGVPSAPSAPVAVAVEVVSDQPGQNDNNNNNNNNNNSDDNDGGKRGCSVESPHRGSFSTTTLTSSPNSRRPYISSASPPSQLLRGQERGGQYAAATLLPHNPPGMMIWVLFTVYTAVVYMIDVLLWAGFILTVAFVLMEVPAAMWDESFLQLDEPGVLDMQAHSEN